MSRNPSIILILVLALGVALNIFRPGGLLAYAFPSICWSIIASAAVWAYGFSNMRSHSNKRLALMATLIAVFQIFILIDAGLLVGFGKSPLSFTPTGLTVNLILVSSTLLGTELSRAYLTKKYGKKRPVLTLGLVTLLYTFITTSIAGFLNLTDPLTTSQFLGTGFLPIVTENLLASYLALLAGPLASLAYRAPIQAFKWFCPILPSLPWGYESIIGVMIPTIGFITISMATTQRDLRKAGILIEKRPSPRLRKSQKSIKGWLVISVFMVLTVWTSTGLLGFYPTIVASGSMRPTMDVGDIAIVLSADPSKIQVGDVIQYWHEGEMTLHRVIAIISQGGARLFQTKGDDNPAPDPELVLPAQIRGKLILTIPKLGWIQIYLKTAIATIWTFLSTNTTTAYALLTAIILTTSIYAIHAYKKRPYRHWPRRRW